MLSASGPKKLTPTQLHFYKFDEWCQSNHQIYDLQSKILELEETKVRYGPYPFTSKFKKYIQIWFEYRPHINHAIDFTNHIPATGKLLLTTSYETLFSVACKTFCYVRLSPESEAPEAISFIRDEICM